MRPDLTHHYTVGFDFGTRMADHDYVYGNPDREPELRQDLARFTILTFRAWTLGALRGYRA